VRQQHATAIGQHDAARRADEQRRAERALQRGEVMRDGRLAVVQRQSGRRQRPLPRDRLEDAQLAKVEDRPIL
jgi:hypothetical protein